MSKVSSKTDALDLDHQDQIEKKLNRFSLHFKLELCIDHLPRSMKGLAWGWGGTLFFANVFDLISF